MIAMECILWVAAILIKPSYACFECNIWKNAHSRTPFKFQFMTRLNAFHDSCISNGSVYEITGRREKKMLKAATMCIFWILALDLYLSLFGPEYVYVQLFHVHILTHPHTNSMHYAYCTKCLQIIQLQHGNVNELCIKL